MEIRKTLVREALTAAGEDDTALRTDYSGRGMYGRTCFGFIGNATTLCKFFVAFVSEAASYSDDDALIERIEVADELAERVRTDDMGGDTIYYFPGVILV